MDELIDETREFGPVAEVQGKETQQILWEAVNRLPKLWAMAVILRYREGKSIQDIAKIMRIRQNTVKTYLFRSREKLRRLLSPVFTEDNDVG
jgi:RNA polymerase sigma-70 factor (ECF subfamily)